MVETSCRMLAAGVPSPVSCPPSQTGISLRANRAAMSDQLIPSSVGSFCASPCAGRFLGRGDASLFWSCRGGPASQSAPFFGWLQIHLLAAARAAGPFPAAGHLVDRRPGAALGFLF